MRYLAICLLAIVMVAGTMFVGWYLVPVAAAGYALLARHERVPREAALAALIAWVALLIRVRLYPSFDTLLTQIGQLFPVSGGVVAALTLVLGVVLAATAARVVIGVTGVTTASR